MTDAQETANVSSTRRQKEREKIGDHAHVEGLTRGTIVEYDDWQWAVVSEIATDEDPTKVGFVLLDDLGDSIIGVLESAWGCWEHYEAIEGYRGGEHEYWTDAEYIREDDIWAVLGPIHPDARSEEAAAGETLVTDGGHRPPCDGVSHMSPTANYAGLERRVCPACRLYFDVGEESESVFCSAACRRRHREDELIADGGIQQDQVTACCGVEPDIRETITRCPQCGRPDPRTVDRPIDSSDNYQKDE